MKVIWYFLTFVFGFLGVLGIARSIELTLVVGHPQAAGVFLALVFSLLAWRCLRRARATTISAKNTP